MTRQRYNEAINAMETRPDWLVEHSAWIRQHAIRAPHQDNGFVDLCQIRARFARQRLTALQEWRRMERRSKRFDDAVIALSMIAGALLCWLSWVLEGRL